MNSQTPTCQSISIQPVMPIRQPKSTALVFTCSGAADVGEITDQAARRLHKEGVAAMSCLASIGARDADIMFNTDIADTVLLIDGCPKACAQRTFQAAGIHKFSSFNLSEAGLFKGRSPMGPENLDRAVAFAKKKLQPPEKTAP